MNITVNSAEELPLAAKKLLSTLGQTRVVLFFGDMGAGKTTFIKAICEELGITDVVSSPSFSIVNEYSSPSGPVYHFDFYRLKDESEALDLGYEDYFYSGAYCFIEWPEKIPNLLPDHCIRVSLEIAGPEERLITVVTF